MTKQVRPDWTTYFLDIATAVGKRSTCLRRKYGAIIVKDKIIISTGYNGAPRGEVNCIDTGNCEREKYNVPKGQRYELCVAAQCRCLCRKNQATVYTRSIGRCCQAQAGLSYVCAVIS